MATKRLFVDGNSGAMFIGDYTVPDIAAIDPTPYMGNLNFHSSLDYVQIMGTITAYNITFAAVNREYREWSDGGKC